MPRYRRVRGQVQLPPLNRRACARFLRSYSSAFWKEAPWVSLLRAGPEQLTTAELAPAASRRPCTENIAAGI